MFKKMISVFVVMWLITFIFVSLSWAENFNVELVGSWQPSDSQGNIDIIKVFGDYAYLGTDQGLCILKVTDPAHPVAVGFCPTIGYVNDIALQGEYVYVASSKPPQGVPGSLRVINISDPQNPYEAGHFDFIDCMEAFNVCIKDHYAYVLTQNLDLVNVKIYTVDIVLPADPHAIGFYSLTDIDRGDIWIEDHYLYITAGYSLLVLDISNPENIHEIGSYIADEYLFKIYMQDHYAYVTQDFSYLIIDIATPFEPKLVTKNIVPFTSSTPLNICVLGDYAYFTHGDLGISILNVANPSSQVAGHYDTPALARDICADSEYIYIADSRFLNAKSSLLVLKFTPNLPAEKPVNLSPPNGTQDTTTLITLRTSGFSDPDNSAHKASQWRVFNSSNVVVFDSGTDAKNLVKITLPQGALNYDATYAWQVRYQDDHNMWSEWSEKTSFATMPYTQFSFVQVSDVHIGARELQWGCQLPPGFFWDSPLESLLNLCENIIYARFLEVLKAINDLDPKPNFIVITGDNVDWADRSILPSQSGAHLKSFQEALKNENFNRLPFYVVPGNHDRYEYELAPIGEGTYGGGNDHLAQYYTLMNKPEGAEFLAGFEQYDQSSDGADYGLDRYNYYFNHNGYLFIGLDSGSDTDLEPKDKRTSGSNDWGPEGAGLHAKHIAALNQLPEYVPKIPFCHHPVLTGHAEEDDQHYPDGCFIGEHDNFVKYCRDNNVKIVLSGHTHENQILALKPNETGNPYVGEKLISGTAYPWFAQTPSATRGNSGAYRIIQVDGDNVSTDCPSVQFQPKIVMSTVNRGDGQVALSIYDSQNRYTGFGSVITDIPNSYYTGNYGSESPQVIILYNTNENYRFEVVGEAAGNYTVAIASLTASKGKVFAAVDIPTSVGAKHRYTVDWQKLSPTTGVTVQKDENGDGTFEETVSAGSVYTPGEIFSLDLQTGQNLISLPVAPSNANVESVLASIEGLYDSVWSYDAIYDWQFFAPYFPAGENDFFNIEPGKGYLIDMYEPATLLLVGEKVADQDIQLYQGWNLVGYSSLTEKSIAQISAGLPNGAIIYGHDSQNQEWLRYTKGKGLDFLNTLKQLEPGKGYWVWVEQDLVWHLQ